MSEKLITAPVKEPVSLDDIRGQLAIADDLSDEVITRRIVEARQWAELFCQRSFITQTWDRFLDCWPDNEIIELARGPVQSVTSIKYVDTSGIEQTILSTEYKISLADLITRIAPAYKKTWPTARAQMDSIAVRYVAGFGSDGSTVPGPIREAIMLTVGHWTEHQPAIESGVRITRIPYAVEHLLHAYRVTPI